MKARLPKRVNYANPTDQLAAMCVEATMPWRAKIERSERYVGVDLGASQLVLRLIRQIARQGLSPNDFNVDNGPAALHAIADAFFSGKTQMAFNISVPIEWRQVYEAARRIIDRKRKQ